MGWLSKYRFVAEDDDGNTRDLVPVVEDFLLSGENSEKFIWQTKIPGVLKFVKEDFTWLYARETEAVGGDQTRCGGIAIRVYVTCSGVELLRWQFFVNLNECEWDPVACQVLVNTQPTDAYSYIFRNWEKEFDVLDMVATKHDVPGLVGYLEIETCGPTSTIAVSHDDLPYTNTCLANPAEAWVILQHYWLTTAITDPTPGSITYDGEYCTIWVRERVDDSPTTPPGDGWIDIGGDSWVREPEVYYYQDGPYYYALPPFNTYVKYWVKLGRVVGASAAVVADELTDSSFELAPPSDPIPTSATIYKNGMTLEDVIVALLDEVSGGIYTIKSNFFRINPDSPLPVTEPYPTAEAGFDAIMVWQTSDIVRPYATAQATDLKLSLKGLLEEMRKVFNTSWAMEGSIFRIEHVSYFDNEEGEDFTADPYLTYIDKKNRYMYESLAMPVKEVFGWAFQVSPFFNGLPILYPFSCASGEKKEDNFTAAMTSADLAYIHRVGDEAPLSGLFFGAMLESGGTYYFAREADGGGSIRNNGHLAFTKLHPNYWLWDRPQSQGQMNGADTVFETRVRLKKQEEISVPVTCEFLFDTFDPNNLIKTQIGWGQVKSWSYSAKKCLLTLQLMQQ